MRSSSRSVAAVRCDGAGFDGVEVYGAYGYLLREFLNAELDYMSNRKGFVGG